MTRIPNRPSSLWLLAASVAVGVVVPLLLGAAAGRSTPDENRRTIAGMSAAEREELQRKYAEYQALPEAERDKYRRLHGEIENDPQAQEVLEEYQQWLRTLTPWQRQELHGEQDWSKRLEIVRRIRQEQQDAQQRRREDDRQRFTWFRPMVRLAYIPGFPRLDRDDLARMMNIIRQSLPEDARRRAESGARSEAKGYARILTEALKQASIEADHSDAAFHWPEPLLMEKLEQAITDDSDRARYQALRGWSELKEKDPEGRRLLLAVIAHGIDVRAEREAGEAELDVAAVFKRQSAKEQEELRYRPALDRTRRLRWLYVGEQRKLFRDEVSELREMLDRLLPTVAPSAERPPFGFPSRHGSDRGEGRGSRDRDGDRRDDGERGDGDSRHRDGRR